MTPYAESSKMSETIGVPTRTAVSSSCTFIRKPPSPQAARTRRLGYSSLAPIAPGSAIPMLANPLEMMQVFGRVQGYIRAIQSLWVPTSLTRISSPRRTSRRSRTTR